jgi:hypothetical protein
MILFCSTGCVLNQINLLEALFTAPSGQSIQERMKIRIIPSVAHQPGEPAATLLHVL